MTGGGEAFGSGARRDRDDEPATAMACGDGDGQDCACHTRCRRDRENGAVDASPGRGHEEDTTSRSAMAEMSLGFGLAPFPQASAVVYGLEYAAALDATA